MPHIFLLLDCFFQSMTKWSNKTIKDGTIGRTEGGDGWGKSSD